MSLWSRIFGKKTIKPNKKLSEDAIRRFKKEERPKIREQGN